MDLVLVIADTHAQADYWIKQLGIENKWIWVTNIYQLVGFSRSAEIIAVGPLKTLSTQDLIGNAKERGFTVKMYQGTH